MTRGARAVAASGLFVVAAAVVVAAAPARAGTGAVDRAAGVVRCTGMGAPRLREAAGNVLVARIAAERAARRDARRSCRAALLAAEVPAGGTVAAALAGDPALAGAVDAAVRRARPSGAPRFFADGGAALELTAPLAGALARLLPPPGVAPPTDAPARTGGGQGAP